MGGKKIMQIDVIFQVNGTNDDIVRIKKSMQQLILSELKQAHTTDIVVCSEDLGQIEMLKRVLIRDVNFRIANYPKFSKLNKMGINQDVLADCVDILVKDFNYLFDYEFIDNKINEIIEKGSVDYE